MTDSPHIANADDAAYDHEEQYAGNFEWGRNPVSTAAFKLSDKIIRKLHHIEPEDGSDEHDDS